MKNYNKTLKWSLWGGAVYLFLIAAAHLFQIKTPALFIYFSVPSYRYQDVIISFLAFGWGMFLYAGSRSVRLKEYNIVKYIIISGAAAIAGLVIINTFTDFKKFNEEIIKGYFWGETLVIFGYILWLFILYRIAVKKRNSSFPKKKIKSYQEYINDEQRELIKRFRE